MTSQMSPLHAALREQKETKMKGGIYHKTQINLTYNSNHIEGSRLTHDQTRYIFETRSNLYNIAMLRRIQYMKKVGRVGKDGCSVATERPKHIDVLA